MNALETLVVWAGKVYDAAIGVQSNQMQCLMLVKQAKSLMRQLQSLPSSAWREPAMEAEAARLVETLH